MSLDGDVGSAARSVRLCIVVQHPIHNHLPLRHALARDPDIDLRVPFMQREWTSPGLEPINAMAGAMVLPSSSEIRGLVVNEAMNFECPILVPDRVGCAPDLVAASVVWSSPSTGPISWSPRCAGCAESTRSGPASAPAPVW